MPRQRAALISPGATPPEIATFARYSFPTFPVRRVNVLTTSRAATLNAAA
jgi:hypothetical protein